ncbi:MAG: methyltransferase [Thermoleophilia bacterium]|nr:methyltransferase [Thermoleophilia bacterium]
MASIDVGSDDPGAGRSQVVDRVGDLLLDGLTPRSVIAVDGVDGAGKTTFADELGAVIERRGIPVLRASVDGFHHRAAHRHARGRTSPDGFYLDSYDYGALVRELLEPFRDGRPVRLAVHDVETDARLGGDPLTADPAAVLVLDGIFLHRPELEGRWDRSVFLRVPFAVSVARCASRDGTDPDPSAPSNRRYVEGQQLYLGACDPASAATIVVDNADLAAPVLVDPASVAARAAVVARLARAGCVSAAEEADLLLAASRDDPPDLAALVDRRCAGEPLAWVTGATRFCDLDLRVEPGVYVPRWHSEVLARRAADRLPPHGRAVDLGTGCGAIAAVLRAKHPGAEVLGAEADARSAACARSNGVDVRVGDLFDALPLDWRGTIDVAVGVLPYVPTAELAFLARDARDHEPVTALDGGLDGTALVRRAIADAATWLRPGGAVLLEVGGDQPDALAQLLASAGYVDVRVLRDEDGDDRGVEATLALNP